MSENQNNKEQASALKVNKGIEQPPSINEAALERLRKHKRKTFSLEDYVSGILSGNMVMLSRAITLIESQLHSDFMLSQQIVERCIPHSGKSFRIGITGVPGAGKSTFIEAFGSSLTQQGHKVAVLAVDPSSEISKGSILGDKTRMEKLATDPMAFVRPSPSAGSLGGVARKTREIIMLCEAAGFDIILVETVGVGQSETAVHSMVDFFLLLMISGAGDELQGIKRGIIEMCDGMIINKADGDNVNRAMAARVQYQNALHLYPPSSSGWGPQVQTCSSIYGTGIEKVWEMIEEYRLHTQANGYFLQRRNEQKKFRMLETINQALADNFYRHPDVAALIPKMESELLSNHITSYKAAGKLLEAYYNSLDKVDKTTNPYE
jgi:LAO/AO transport system kinase